MRWLLILGGILAALALIALLAFGWAWWAVKSVPAEYERVLVVAPEIQQKSSKEFEVKVTNLVSETKRANDWQHVFTQDEANAWLADLPRKIEQGEIEHDPLPKELREPRIVLSPGRVQLFVRYDSPEIQAVVSLDVEVALTDQPNQLALKLRAARAGTFPLPLDELTKRVTDAAVQAELPFQWRDDAGTPVLILTIPPDHPRLEREVHLEKLEIRAGLIFLQGRTGKARR